MIVSFLDRLRQVESDHYKKASNPAHAENGFVLTRLSNVCVALRRQQVKSSKPVLSLSPGIRISC